LVGGQGALAPEGLRMKKYGLVASGGGYRSFYTGGVLVWLKQNDVLVTHLTSTSSGNNIVLDYLTWDWDKEELPPVLTKTMRLSIRDISDVFKNFAGLTPALIPTGAYMFKVNPQRTRKSLLLDEPERRNLLASHLQSTRWDILTTNLTERKSELFNVNDILSKIDDRSLARFMQVFIAGITTIPYFEAVKMDGKYYLEGGYTDNTPLRSLFEDPEVDEIIAVDFTNYDYHTALENAYKSPMFAFAKTSIDMNLLVSDMQWCLPNISVLSQAILINRLLESLKKPSIEIDGKTYFHKPLHILKPKNLEAMTISLKEMRAQKEYFQLGQESAEVLFNSILESGK
jgi:predicted acylesterase/phospholipase RssA